MNDKELISDEVPGGAGYNYRDFEKPLETEVLADDKELIERCLLTNMGCLQSRLDYAHHITKKANRKGSHEDDRAIQIGVLTKAIPIIRKAAAEEIKSRICECGYLIRNDKHGHGFLVTDDLWARLFGIKPSGKDINEHE